jgi:hypothetical protein
VPEVDAESLLGRNDWACLNYERAQQFADKIRRTRFRRRMRPELAEQSSSRAAVYAPAAVDGPEDISGHRLGARIDLVEFGPSTCRAPPLEGLCRVLDGNDATGAQE